MGSKINNDMIVLARDARGLSQDGLAKLMGVSQAKISKFENGLLDVPDRDLDALCNITKFHREFFYSSEPIHGLGSSMLFNRKKKTVPIGVQRQIQARVNIARIQLLRMLKATEIEAANKFERLDVQGVECGAEEVARRVRAAWRVPMGPIRGVTNLIEAAGGVILLCDFGTVDVDAAHLWLPAEPPMFFMNSAAPGDRHRFNLAHELGHAIMHQFPVGDIESEAHAFAAEFLMPAREIAPELSNLTLQKLAVLKQRWKVSMAALIYHARRIGVIGESKATSLFSTLSRMGYRLAEPIEIPKEEPTLVPQLLALHRNALGYNDHEMFRLFMTDQPDFINACNELKIRQPLRYMDDKPLSFEAHLKKKQA